MGLSSSTVKEQITRGSWTIQVNLNKPTTDVSYTLTNTTDQLVKVVKSGSGSTVTMIVDPKTHEMTLNNNSTGCDGDLESLSEVLNHIGATLKNKWNLSCEFEDEDEGEDEEKSSSDDESDGESDNDMSDKTICEDCEESSSDDEGEDEKTKGCEDCEDCEESSSDTEEGDADEGEMNKTAEQETSTVGGVHEKNDTTDKEVGCVDNSDNCFFVPAKVWYSTDDDGSWSD